MKKLRRKKQKKKPKENLPANKSINVYLKGATATNHGSIDHNINHGYPIPDTNIYIRPKVKTNEKNNNNNKENN